MDVASRSAALPSPPAANDVSHPLPLGLQAGWGTGAVTIAVMATGYGALMLRFMTDYLGIAAGMAAAMVGVSKLYDAFADPLIGGLSDRADTPIGRRRPFLLLGAFACPLSLVSLFVAPHFGDPRHAAIYMFVMLIGFATAWSIWTVPYTAMAVEMTNDYNARSRLISFRTYGIAAGQFLAATGGPWLLATWGGGRAAHEHVALVLAAVILVSSLICFASTAKAPFRPSAARDAYSMRQKLALALGNGPFVRIVTVKFFMFTALAMVGGAHAYFVKFVLHTSDMWLGTAIIVQTLGTVVSMPLWLRIGKTVDKKWAAVAAMGVEALVWLSWLAASPEQSRWWFAARMAIHGVGVAGFNLFAYSMLTDTIAYDVARTGLRREGVFSGIYNLVEKLSAALGLFLLGSALSIAGYVRSTAGASATQPPRVAAAVMTSFSAIPAAIALVGLLLLLGYNLDKQKLRSLGVG